MNEDSFDIRVCKHQIAALEERIPKLRARVERIDMYTDPIARQAYTDALRSAEHRLAEERAALETLRRMP